MMMTGNEGKRALTCLSRSSPDSPGIRMSETRTCGGSAPRSSCDRASLAEAKLLNGTCSRDSVFSNTQRIDLSSSTIQTGFIDFPDIMMLYVETVANSLPWLDSTLSFALAVIQAQRHPNRKTGVAGATLAFDCSLVLLDEALGDRKSTRLNSSHA